MAVDKLYCPPKRSEAYHNLQSVIGRAMTGMEYSAPQNGENQQMVQLADLDGDGKMECIIFARSMAEKPLKILIFAEEKGSYVLKNQIDTYGTGFDRVEYIQMDDRPGAEMVVGSKLSDQLLRTVSVYSFDGGSPRQLLSANYREFLCADLDGDGSAELVLFYPGFTAEDNGEAALYRITDGKMRQIGKAPLSEPVSKLTRLITGKLSDGVPAVFAASAAGRDAIVTDVLAVRYNSFQNITALSRPEQESCTYRSHFVYAEDIDGDGVVELPELLSMPSAGSERTRGRSYLISWYALASDGTAEDKMLTFHDYDSGWYLELPREWEGKTAVVQKDDASEFYLRQGGDIEKVLTVYSAAGEDREEKLSGENRFPLYRGEITSYAARLEVTSGGLGLTQEELKQSFHLIHQDWNTGER